MKTAVITGITGQDAAYLAECLLAKNYVVYGTYRRTSSTNFWRLEELNLLSHPNLKLVENDITDFGAVIRLIDMAKPEEIYNLAAQSFVALSFDQPMTTTDITGVSVLNLLEAIRIINPKIRFYQASTSEMYGKVQEIPQSEKTPFYPRSPYGVAKLYGHWMTINYRESYNIFASTGILFNHESPLRGLEFVTRKITDGLARVKLGQQKYLELGNLDAQRDWGYARDYVEGMWRMLQANLPETYVLATGRMVSVRYFVEKTSQLLDMKLQWKGEGDREVGFCAETGREIVKVNPKYYRPAEVDLLIGDPTKAKTDLGWEHTVSVDELCQLMVEADFKRVSQSIKK